MIRSAYVRGARMAAGVAERSGLDRWLAGRRSPIALHLRSLFAIYDADRMLELGLPWWTYKAIREVEQFLDGRDGKARVFEFGSGASTLWLAERAGEVQSVEHDEEWVEVLRRSTEPFDHVDLRCVPPTPRRPDSTAVSKREGYQDRDFGDYVASIGEAGDEFDLIVVDGRARAACLAAALPHLADDGMVVFDNANRTRYQPAIEASGLTVDVKRGWAPSLPYRDATALLRRPSP
jgi:hypothetical protein